jgi:Sec-independent protein translocase protein TatA
MGLMLDFIKNLGPGELVIIVLIVSGMLGSSKVKQLAEGLGESAKELKKVKQEIDNVKSDMSEVIGGVK